MSEPSVADVVGTTIAELGVADAFGVIGSGNLIVTNALCGRGVRFHHARHEGGAICMADGYARVSGRVGICSVHQGPGLTNMMTGLTEAAKSRTPLLVLAGETPAAALTSNFRIDQHGLVESVGAIADRVHSPKTAPDDAQRAYERAQTECRPVVLMLPIDIQAQPARDDVVGREQLYGAQNQPRATQRTRPQAPPKTPLAPTEPSDQTIGELADAIAKAQRPAIIAGRGAVLADAGTELEALGELTGAVLTTSAPANGLFHGLPYSLGISGSLASPYASRLLPQADLYLVFGASVNHWTTKHGALINPDATLIQIDIEPRAIGRHRRADMAIIGDARQTAIKLTRELQARSHRNTGFRTTETADSIASHHWRNEPYEDASTDDYVDPRTLTIAIHEALPHDVQIAVDSGHFLGYPSMYLDVPDARSWIFTNGFQAVGLGLGNAIGAAIANPDRTTVAAIGDGGAFMSLAEIETAARLKLGNLLVLIYDDAAYGAEVHHFAPMGHDVTNVKFPDANIAAIATAAGARATTVRTADDASTAINGWQQDQHGRPLVLDAKVNPTICAEWLEEAFRAG